MQQQRGKQAALASQQVFNKPPGMELSHRGIPSRSGDHTAQAKRRL